MTGAMASAPLYGVDETILAVGLVVALMLAAEVGFRIGRRWPLAEQGIARTQVGALQGALLGLLALLLGFSFQMAESRFDFRRLVTLEEANVIGTTFLRSRLLPEPQRGRCDALLRRYVDVRIEFYSIAGASRRSEIPPEVREPSERLDRALWAQAEQAAAREPHSLPVSMFVTSLNQLIDLHERRVVALETRVPGMVLAMLVLVAASAFFLVGFGYGGSDRRRAGLTALAALVVAAVITLIIDLDRPLRGQIWIGQGSMLRLRESIAQMPPAE